jgi:hypothetical protein
MPFWPGFTLKTERDHLDLHQNERVAPAGEPVSDPVTLPEPHRNARCTLLCSFPLLDNHCPLYVRWQNLNLRQMSSQPCAFEVLGWVPERLGRPSRHPPV